VTSQAELAEFRDPFAHATWDDYTASAVVLPIADLGWGSVIGNTLDHGVTMRSPCATCCAARSMRARQAG
jgi:hypothetical protein